MPLTEFALNYKKQITLNYHQMVELSKALAHRSVEYLKRITDESSDEEMIEVYRENLDTIIEISKIINPLIDEAVLMMEFKPKAILPKQKNYVSILVCDRFRELKLQSTRQAKLDR